MFCLCSADTHFFSRVLVLNSINSDTPEFSREECV